MKNIELETPIEELSDDDVRATLADVMTAHAENVAEYSALSDERDELTAERDELSEQVNEAAAYFAERATETVNLPAETLVERFTFSEIREMAEQADEASATQFSSEEGDVDGTEADEADEPETKFSDKPEQATVGGDQSPARSQARADLSAMFGGYDD
jgi:predicted nuclease with TOPRIM domain